MDPVRGAVPRRTVHSDAGFDHFSTKLGRRGSANSAPARDCVAFCRFVCFIFFIFFSGLLPPLATPPRDQTLKKRNLASKRGIRANGSVFFDGSGPLETQQPRAPG